MIRNWPIIEEQKYFRWITEASVQVLIQLLAFRARNLISDIACTNIISDMTYDTPDLSVGEDLTLDRVLHCS